MVNRKAAMAFGSWSYNVAMIHAQAASIGHMSRALKYFINRNLARGWVGWHEKWAEQRRKLLSMRRSLRHLLNRQLSIGWGAW